MNKMTLRLKLLSLIIPSILVILVLGFLIVSNEYENKSKAILLKSRVEQFIQTSKIIHQSQVERGKSNSYIGKKITKEEYQDYQTQVDNLMNQFDLNIDPLFKADLLKVKQLISNARTEALAGNAAVTISTYTEMISHLIKLQVKLLENVGYEGIEGKVLSLTIFESSKESMGKLRGNLNGVFAQNLKKEMKDRDLYSSFIVAITINIESPGLIISKESKDEVFKILNSDGWKNVLKNVEVFAEKYQTGDYGVSANEFFENITKQIDSVNQILIQEQKAQLNSLEQKIADANKKLIYVAGLIGLTLLIVSLYSFFSIKKLNFQFLSIVDLINKSVVELNATSAQIAAGSEELSQATIEQASSLQETSSSIEEISTMVDNTKEFATQSDHVAQDAVNESHKGQVVVKELISSIKDIDNNNKNVVEQINELNQEIEKVMSVINEIANKTKVINDIVFQTKLLSFNASVEAARAGEQGKGFAVVAEEVGSLAQMSGKAALEITSILSESTKTIEAIVSQSQIKAQQLISQSNNTIGAGVKVASECEIAFNNLNNKVIEISKMSHEISCASNEQTKGILEINKAIVQLDQVAQLNSTTAMHSTNSALTLEKQSVSLVKVVKELDEIVNGGVHSKAS